MIKLIVMGHGHFASGILSSLELIAGKQEDVIGIDFIEGMSSEDVQIALKGAIADSKEVLVLADLLGGTPFKVASALMMELSDVTMNVISGTNLTMLVEVAFARMTAESLDALVTKSVATGKEGIIDWKTLLGNDDEEADDVEGGI